MFKNKLAVFINTAMPLKTPTWSLVGDAMSEGGVVYNPQTLELMWSTNRISGKYETTIASPMTAIQGDGVFDFVMSHDSESTAVLLVYLYKNTDGKYLAEKVDGVIVLKDIETSFNSLPQTVQFTIAVRGSTARGTFDPSTKTFVKEESN